MKHLGMLLIQFEVRYRLFKPYLFFIFAFNSFV